MKMFRFVWILATAILIVFASIAAAQTAQQVAAVPDVTGMKATEAQRMLVQQGWKAGMEYRTVADPKQDGAVLATRPPAGARVSKQQVLILVAGKLTDQTRVPNVTGMPLAEAQKALVANKLNAGVIRENTADPGKNQIVLKQQIALMQTEGLKVKFTDDAVRVMAEIADQVNRTQQNIGARRLYTVVEKVMEEASFDAPQCRQKQLTIDGAYVRARLADIAKDEDLSKFIL